tara:strand:+ start:2916 stop:3200 length:285 start_codon:yes stop_codon:yes gene_type:complete
LKIRKHKYVMSYLNKMYGHQVVQNKIEKNPNRVLGGLRGQGVDTFTMLGEDGQEQQIPTKAYVQGLEDKVKKQDLRISVLEKSIRRLTNEKMVR